MSDDLRCFIVGGAVRDRLLGLPVSDRDWVVVGASADDMLARGFRAVGKDFPVFLHPQTQEEYALARTERKTGRGYKGFAFHASPDVTLEDDLARRDLTINAIAEDEHGQLIDPYGGQRDLAERVFRHVSPAFAEDPVRILRVARFAARFTEFTVAPETLSLMRQMVAAGEVDHLVPERVWQEIARGLMCARPSRMIAILRECGALARLLPELDALFGVPQPPEHHPEIDTGLHVCLVVDTAARENAPLPVRFAALVHDLGKGVTPVGELPHHHGHEARGVELVQNVCERLRVPVDCRDLAVMTAREHGIVHRALELRAGTMAKLFTRCDVLRRVERFDQMLMACEADFHGRTGRESKPYPQADLLRRAARAYASVDAGAIAQTVADKTQIPQRLLEARIKAIEEEIR